MNRTGTLILYILTISIATIFALKSQKKIMSQKGIFYNFKFPWFVLSFFSLWFVSAFTNIGVDYDSYLRIIRLASVDRVWGGEIGFNFMCLFLKICCNDNYDLVIFVIKTMTLLIIFRSLYLLRGHMRIGVAVFAFTLMAYLRFYLISMQLATALILLSITYLYLASNRKGIVFYIFAILIHYSSVFLLPMYVLFFIITACKKKFSRLQIALLVLAYTVAFFGIYQIYNLMVSNFSIFSQYSAYTFINSYEGLGIMQLLYYIPIFYSTLMIYMNSGNKRLINLSIVMVLTGFFFAMLGYRLEVMSRMYEHFMGIYMLCVPVFFYERKTGNDLIKKKFIFNYRTDLIIWGLYIVIRGIDVMNDILKINSSAMLDNWEFFFPL